jgi:selenocysteine lyase/cysteine desulfurase
MLDLTHAPDDPETALLKLCDSNTRLIAVSAVQYANGLRMDLQRIGEFCQRHDILFCVDAIQQLGVIPLDVQAIQADFVVADGHKWLLAPEGLGLFYVRQTHLAQLKLTQYGWHTAESLSDYSVQTYQIAQSARRFECGSPNMLGIHALYASLNVLLTHGIADIWQQVSERIEFLIQGLSAIPEVELLSDTRLERRSGIVSFKLKQGDTDALYQYLQANGVFCAPRGGGIRLSPHFYTPMTQLARVLELVRLAA